jgi:hypothetical protein
MSPHREIKLHGPEIAPHGLLGGCTERHPKSEPARRGGKRCALGRGASALR